MNLLPGDLIMTEDEYKSVWFDLWYADYVWIWYLAKIDMYRQWPYNLSQYEFVKVI